MQVGSKPENPRSEATIIVIAVGMILLGLVAALPSHSPEIAHFVTPSQPVSELLAGTTAVVIVMLIIALPLGFLSAVFIHILPQSTRRNMFTMILMLRQTPLFLWGFAAALPLLTSDHIVSPRTLTLYLATVLGLLSIPRVTIEVLVQLEKMPYTWEETLIGLGADHRQLYWSIILPEARRSIFQTLFLLVASTAAEGSLSLLILGQSTTIAAVVAGSLVGKPLEQIAAVLGSFKPHLTALVAIYVITQLSINWVFRGDLR